MRRARIVVKILHSVAAAGLIGGLACHGALLAFAPQATPEAYADLRAAVAAISNIVLLPSLAVAIVSGLLAMLVHTPFLDKGWVWLKAVMGILMFKGVLLVVVAEANQAARVASQIAAGAAPDAVIAEAMYREWWALGAIMLLSILNVVLGVWRPRLMKPAPTLPAREGEALSPAE